jgi:NAD-dependent DNA ligase
MLPALDDALALQAQLAAARDRLHSLGRPAISPADYVRLRDRLWQIEHHPALQSALSASEELRRLFSHDDS